MCKWSIDSNRSKPFTNCECWTIPVLTFWLPLEPLGLRQPQKPSVLGESSIAEAMLSAVRDLGIWGDLSKISWNFNDLWTIIDFQWKKKTIFGRLATADCLIQNRWLDVLHPCTICGRLRWEVPWMRIPMIMQLRHWHVWHLPASRHNGVNWKTSNNMCGDFTSVLFVFFEFCFDLTHPATSPMCALSRSVKVRNSMDNPMDDRCLS